MSQPSIKAPPFVRYVMYFNGQNASAVVSPNPAFYGSQLTVVAWFAIISNPSSWAGVVDTTVYTDKNWWIITTETGVCQAGAGAQYSNGKTGLSYPIVNCGEVHQYVFRLNGNENSIFFDGKLYQTQPGSGSYVTDTSLPLVIGGRPHGPLPSPPYYFSNVAVWQVLVYNRALSDAEIAQLYSNPTNPIRDGLVLWLQADPAYIQGSTWIDLSGNGNNATLYNAQLIQLAPSIPWFWVGVGAVTAFAVATGLWIAHSKGLI
jgi:hypothetical protein